MTRIAIAAFSLLASLAAGCSQESWRLVSGEKGDAAEIRISGDEGEASWSWGPDNFTVEVTVVKSSLAAPGASRSAELTLALADGSHLEFAGPRSALVCRRGCDSLHLPNAWVVRND